MLRQMIKIDEDACTGCGLCVSACHEGAIAMKDGKARLIRDDYSDGLGNCLPACPAGAISFEMRESAPYDEEGVKAMVADIEKTLGSVDILVNNAGIIKRVPMHEMPAEEFRQVIDIDLVAPYICAKAVIPGMMERKAGKIINVCSMMSELGRETVSAYAAAKGGLKMLTKNIASEYGAYNIQCNGIGPGYIATPQTAPLRERQADGSRHPFDSFIVAKTPAERWGNPEDLMGPVVFLASNASDFVNGHVLYVDGGILAYIGKQPK